MQGVQVAPAIHDENSTRGSLLHSAFKENASGLPTAGKPGSTLKTARKAFGNITNTRCDATSQQAGGTVVKRRFGQDITNSAIKEPNAATAKKPPVVTHWKHSNCSGPESVPTVVAAAAAPAAASWWETAELERPAGKTWEQLEVDRLREEDEEIERDVRELMAGIRGTQLFKTMFGVGAASDIEDADFSPGPPPPMPDSISELTPLLPRHVQIDSSRVVFDYPGKDRIADLLPDINIPWTDPDIAAELESAAQPADDAVQPQAIGLSTSGLHVVSSPAALQDASDGISSIVTVGASADVEEGWSLSLQQLQQQQYSSCSSPSVAETVDPDPATPPKSPEMLPW